MLGQEFLEILSDALAINGFNNAIGAKGFKAFEPPGITDDQEIAVFNTMLADDRVQTVRSVGLDSTLLRLSGAYGTAR